MIRKLILSPNPKLDKIAGGNSALGRRFCVTSNEERRFTPTSRSHSLVLICPGEELPKPGVVQVAPAADDAQDEPVAEDAQVSPDDYTISYITNAADTNPANAVKSDDHTDAKATAAVKGHPGSMQFQENIPIITYTQLGLSSFLDI